MRAARTLKARTLPLATRSAVAVEATIQAVGSSAVRRSSLENAMPSSGSGSPPLSTNSTEVSQSSLVLQLAETVCSDRLRMFVGTEASPPDDVHHGDVG